MQAREKWRRLGLRSQRSRSGLQVSTRMNERLKNQDTVPDLEAREAASIISTHS